MTDEFRLPFGGGIDRASRLAFRFNGRSYQGFSGDTLASALLANGVSLTGRSFKYHRPRGIVGAGVEEPASLVELLGEHQSANQPITTVRLSNGLRARSVNCWPSPDFDVMAVNQMFAGLLPAAFYYKTFMWPNWRLFEPSIRRAAGLASAPKVATAPGTYESRHAHCDVLVVGAGPAGLMAALAAGRAGARVMLVDDQPEPGGALLSGSPSNGGRDAMDWVREIIDELESLTNVVRLCNATAWGYRDHNLIMIVELPNPVAGIFQRSWRVRARQVIVAAGAIERALVFADNDRPGVMLASAARTYVNRYAVRPGRRAVVFTNNDSAYEAARDLQAAGIAIAAIVDSRSSVAPHLLDKAGSISVQPGSVVAGTAGYKRVRAVRVRPESGGPAREIACDLVCVSGGWSPTVHLFSQSRGKLRYDKALASFLPDQPMEQTQCAGAADGKFDLRAALESGLEAGFRAAVRTGHKAVAVDIPPVEATPPYRIDALWHVEQDHPSAKSFVDIQNDVTVNDIHLAIREGLGAIEHVKRYTTAGMGIDQGKTANMNVIGVIAKQAGVEPEAIGTTTFRAPFAPVDFGAIAGRREGSVVLPYRHTPMTGWHNANGAVMYEAGARWRRPGYYPRAGESFQATVNRESCAVREGVGVYDGSPLGKFEIRGPDALKLLEMVYTNSYASLEIGGGRYGLMMTEDGLIFDDGVTFRLAENHYLMSTSTGNADAVQRKLEEFLQLERPEWKVAITPVTGQWSNATICGPQARQVLAALDPNIDISNVAFPFMSIRDATVAALPARICRVSFTGELSFEINVAGRHGLVLWERIMEAGKRFGIAPIGSEANHVLRVEKGFLSLGHEADSTADAHDLGMGWIVSKSKPDYIGKRAVEIRRSSGKPRRELVGLLVEDPIRMVTEGAPLTPGGRKAATEGLVTASVWSVVQNRAVALGLLSDGRSRIGETAHIRLKNDVVAARVVEPCFHDPRGERLRS